MKRYFVVAPPQNIMLASKRITEVIAKGTEAEKKSVHSSKAQPGTFVAELSSGTATQLAAQGHTLYEDVQFQIFQEPSIPARPSAHYWRPGAAPMLDVDQGNLSVVMEQIGAPAAWRSTRGAGSTIAVVDTGITGTLAEFAPQRRSALDVPSLYHGNHWADGVGHGSMCAAIAAGSKNDGGKYDGVAPEATILAARTDLSSADIFIIYDELITAKRDGRISSPLVISNSYGLYTCSPPNVLPRDHPYLKNVLAAVDAGITVVFAAGNNHADVICNFDPTADHPNSIWSVNSHDQVISVGTVDRNSSNQTPPSPHVNSSRGPGEWAETHKKPDVVAPTYGEIVWGSGYRVMPWWGTSGACPQVAGLAALMLAVAPALMPAQVAEILRRTARALPAPATCVGAGMIDCGAAVTAAGAGV
jgi:serine protease AprX